MVKSVFLASSDKEDDFNRRNLSSVMESAGISILNAQVIGVDENLWKNSLRSALENAGCSLHIITRNYGDTLKSDSSVSVAEAELNEARKKLHEDPDFKLFIWYPPDVVGAVKDPKQEQFINKIRNSIERNMIFSNASSPIQLVDDIRTLMQEEEKETFDIQEAEVFLIFNELDEFQAAEIIDMIADIIDVKKLNIIQDSDMDYSEYCFQQIGKSKLAVVYFKETAEWALPFTQQVWKKVGGATSHTPILLIGDEEPDSNLTKKLKAPKIISLIVAGELIPLEIKVQYDKIIEQII